MSPPLRPDRTRPTPRWVRRLVRTLLLAVVLSVAVVASFVLLVSRGGADESPAPGLSGAFVGLGSAAGMRIVMTETGARPAGRFIDSNGVEAVIGGGWRDGGVEAVLDFPDRPVFVRLDPVAMGLSMAVLPLDAEARPMPDQRRVLAFLRAGIEAPAQPPLYMDPPVRSDGETDPDVFLQSYQFWPADGVARGFSQIGARYRTMIRFFPQLHADVLWKLCAAETGRDLLAEALRGQGADCAAVTSTVARLQQQGRFMEWKRAVQADIDRLTPSVQCARGFIVRDEVCAPAARRIAEAAVSMETVSEVLGRWR